jgi:hypothetical protein
LDWLQGEDQQHAIVGLIGKILDRAVTVKMTCEQAEQNRLPWTPEWSTMASTWEAPWRGCLSEWDGGEGTDDDWLYHSLHGEFQDEDGKYIKAIWASSLLQSRNSLPLQFPNINIKRTVDRN